MPHRDIKHPKRFPGSDQEFKVTTQQDGHIVPPEATYDGDTDEYTFDTSNKRTY